jgi:polyisoprenoid-binding protein YceI
MNKLFLALLLLPAAALATPLKLASSAGSVEFLAITKPSFIKIKGTGKSATTDVKVDGQKASGIFEFDLATLDTGMDGRNDHMKNKYLQVEQYPKAKLEITDLALKAPFKTGETAVEEAPFTGVMTLHGVTKPVTGTYSLKKTGDVIAKFGIKLSDFKIEQPSFMGVTVKDDVDVSVNIAQLKEVK